MAVPGSKVVVVEDHESMRKAILRLLRAAGFEASAYVSAEAVLADDAARDPACVVSDLMLPAMSGLELLAELRARGWRASLILMTAYDAPGLGDEALRRGAAAYLVKPFHGTSLLTALRAVIAPTRVP